VDTLSYSFKRAPRREAETWRLTGTALEGPGGLHLALSDITGGRFSDMPAGERWATCLVLEHGDTTLKLACRDVPAGASRAQFMSMTFALLGDLAIVQPGARFRSGGGRASAYGLVAAGSFFAAIGIFAGARGLFSADPAEGQAALTISSVALMFGLFLCWAGAPWAKPHTRTPAELMEWLRSWLARHGTQMKAAEAEPLPPHAIRA